MTRIPGLGEKPTILSSLQVVKAMAQLNGKKVLPDVKMPRKGHRGKDKGPRQQPEAALRTEIVSWLKSNKCKYWRIENGVFRHTGLPDFLFFHPRAGFFFMELKSADGRLTGRQPLFQELCQRHKVPHIVIRSVAELEAATVIKNPLTSLI